MVKRPTGSGGEPSSPNCGASAEGRARHLFFFLYPLKKPSTRADTGVMAEETTEATQEDLVSSTPEVPEGTDAPVEAASEAEEQAAAESTTEAEPEPQALADVAAAPAEPENTAQQIAAPEASEPEQPKEPDELQPFIDKAFETIQHDVEIDELDKFLRAHIKTFREEWDIWPDSAKDAYVHMMASQHIQRKAARTRIMNYEEFKLPVPSAQTTLFESIQQSQIKPKKCIPVLLMPPNLRPTYSLKK